jgi:hypothetical protein
VVTVGPLLDLKFDDFALLGRRGDVGAVDAGAMTEMELEGCVENRAASSSSVSEGSSYGGALARMSPPVSSSVNSISALK